MNAETEEAPLAIPAGRLERAARAMIGAASGGVLGLIVAGLLGLGRRITGTGAMLGTVGVVVVCAAAMAVLNLRGRRDMEPAPPRGAFGVILSAAGLLLTLVVFLAQSTYIQMLAARGEKTELPLPIWPMSRLALIVSLIAAIVGVIAAFMGWIQGMRTPGIQRPGRWVAMALLAAGAWLGIALAVYATGRGLIFGG